MPSHISSGRADTGQTISHSEDDPCCHLEFWGDISLFSCLLPQVFHFISYFEKIISHFCPIFEPGSLDDSWTIRQWLKIIWYQFGTAKNWSPTYFEYFNQVGQPFGSPQPWQALLQSFHCWGEGLACDQGHCMMVGTKSREGVVVLLSSGCATIWRNLKNISWTFQQTNMRLKTPRLKFGAFSHFDEHEHH